MLLHHRTHVEENAPSPVEEDESSQPRLSRKRKIVAGVTATALAAGIVGGVLSRGGESSKSKSAKPAATAQPNTPTTTAVGTSAIDLCAELPPSSIAEDLGPLFSNPFCTSTSDATETVQPFTSLDIAHAVWGGPEGQAPLVVITIKDLFNQGQDQYRLEQQLDSEYGEEAISVNNQPATYIPRIDTSFNGAAFEDSIVLVNTGKYVVNVVVEQLNQGVLPNENAMLTLATAATK